MIDENMKSKLDAHWVYLENIIRLSYELGKKCKVSWETLRPLTEELYLSAMQHGYKHAVEEMKNTGEESK